MSATVAERRPAKSLGATLSGALTLIRTHAFEIAAFILPFALFTFSASRQVSSWDTAEMQGVPYILGIAHPTGFPLYVLCGFLFSHLVPAGTVAFRLNVFSAACVAGACCMLYFAAREFAVPRLCALAAAWWYSVTAIVWNHAIRAEVHDLALLCCTACVLYLIRWQKNGREAHFLCAVTALGLALATHPLAVWLLPGALIAVALRSPDRTTTLRALGAIAACLAIYLYLPVRSFIVVHLHLDPAAGLEGQNGGLFWNLNNPSSWAGLMQVISGSQFGAGETLFGALNSTTMQSDLWSWLTSVNQSYGAYGLVLALLGISFAWARDWKNALILLVSCLTIVPFTYAYAAVEGDSDRYRMIALWIVPLLMACAATAAPENDRTFSTIVRRCFVLAAMLTWGVETYLNNAGIANNRTDNGNVALIHAAATHIPRGAIVLITWVDATSFAYGAYVDHTLDGRIVIAGWPNGEEQHFASWMKSHPVYVVAGEQPNPYPGLRFLRRGSLDDYHPVWLVESAAKPR